ncbi:hypothetical protein MW887_001939 [Aspergillus wentii]|nr:hypothetical protein MW887_001939 [Aspergillus wentii]
MDKFTKEDIARYREAFAVFDEDGSGDITAQELAKVMRSLGLNPSDIEVQDMVHELDLDRTGTIDFQEFLTSMAAKVTDKDTEAAIRQAFRVFDQDNSGTISADEIRRVMSSIGDILSDDDIDEMIRMADVNGDGTIDCRFF